MARGGYFQGSDWVEYSQGNLSHSSATSAREIKKQKTVVCPKCKREVPHRKTCLFCGNDLSNL